MSCGWDPPAFLHPSPIYVQWRWLPPCMSIGFLAKLPPCHSKGKIWWMLQSGSMKKLTGRCYRRLTLPRIGRSHSEPVWGGRPTNSISRFPCTLSRTIGGDTAQQKTLFAACVGPQIFLQSSTDSLHKLVAATSDHDHLSQRLGGTLKFP